MRSPRRDAIIISGWIGAFRKFRKLAFTIAVLGWASLTHGWCEDVTVILGSTLPPYELAYQGFTENANGIPFTRQPIEERAALPADTKIVLAIGGKAAIKSYPKSAILVVAMAPGLTLSREPGRRVVQIHTTPTHTALLSILRELPAPNQRIGTLAISVTSQEYIRRLTALGTRDGFLFQNELFTDEKQIPQILRRLAGKIDTLWVPPDPLLLNPTNFKLLTDFSASNRIALWVPTAGLAEKGGAGALAPSFHEIGRSAAEIIAKLRRDEDVPENVYADRCDLTLNKAFFEDIGRPLPAKLRDRAYSISP